MSKKISKKIYSKTLRLSVPSSLILFGEYFITKYNNSALCLAPNLRCFLDISIREGNDPITDYPTSPTTSHATKTNSSSGVPSETSHALPLSLKSSYANQTIDWETPQQCPLFFSALELFDRYKERFQQAGNRGSQHSDNMYNTIQDFLACNNISHDTKSNSQPYHMHAHINSNQLYNANNQKDASLSVQKLGLGSSEACMVLCCIIILLQHTINPFENLNILAQYAAHAHYLFQKGKGSGYGIYTSVFGGVGIYQQKNNYQNDQASSDTSEWHPYSLPNSLHWYFLKGEKEISSPNSVEVFNDWCSKNTTKTEIYQAKINTLFSELAQASEADSFIHWVSQAKSIGIELGQELGISAHIQSPQTTMPIIWKATGAGNENAIGVSSHNHVLENSVLDETNKQTIFPISIDKGILCH